MKFSLVFFALSAGHHAQACDTTEAIEMDKVVNPGIHGGLGGSSGVRVSAPLTLLHQDSGDEAPACLDGSPQGYYYVPSSTNSTSWTISIEGGGWCYDEDSCLSRAGTDLGSSKNWAESFGCGCMNIKADAAADDIDPIDHDCNCIYLPYCDGASFSGFRPEPWDVPNSPGDTLIFRGIKNFDGVVNAALELGMSEATDFVLTGGSAGGLSTFLHADRVASKLPSTTTVTAAPVVGYFLDHDNFVDSDSNYTAWMKYIYGMQNLTFGEDGGLTAECEALYPNDPHYCFMSPHMHDVIKTPYYVFNSKYDSWQLANELQTTWETEEGQAAVIQYGKDFDDQFEGVTKEDGNGAFTTTCICHGCPWSDLQLDGRNSYQHYADWKLGRTQGSEAFNIDTRGPNGDGDLVFDSCLAFP